MISIILTDSTLGGEHFMELSGSGLYHQGLARFCILNFIF
jgi:hypothetical protein